MTLKYATVIKETREEGNFGLKFKLACRFGAPGPKNTKTCQKFRNRGHIYLDEGKEGEGTEIRG